MPSLYPSLTKDNGNREYHRPSIDGNTEVGTTYASHNWQQQQQQAHHHSSNSSSSSGWNHNHHGENNAHSQLSSSSSSPPLSTLISSTSMEHNNNRPSSMQGPPTIDKHYTSPPSPVTSTATSGSTIVSTSYNSPAYFVSPSSTHNTAGK